MDYKEPWTGAAGLFFILHKVEQPARTLHLYTRDPAGQTRFSFVDAESSAIDCCYTIQAYLSIFHHPSIPTVVVPSIPVLVFQP